MNLKVQQREMAMNKRHLIINKEEKSQAIIKRLLDIIKPYNKIGIYISLDDEVNTKGLLEVLIDMHKAVFAPRVNKDTMSFYQINSFDDLKRGSFKVLEPTTSIEGHDLEVLVIPLVAYDRQGNRLGYGKGYYDKYLVNKSLLKVGLAFWEQEISSIEINQYDVRLDILVNEVELIDFRENYKT